MTSIGLRPALLFFSLTGVNTAASISARKLSNGTTRAIISSGSPFAEIAASRRSASKNPNCPIVPTLANLVVTSQTRTNSRRSLFFEVPFRVPSECDAIAGFRSSCAGTLDEVSFYGDYHFTKRFDVYAGIAYSQVTGGLAIAIPHGPGVPYYYNNNIAPT